jgi:putative metalloprotease
MKGRGGVMPGYFALWLCFVFMLSGCGNTDVMTATDAGLDAVKAITLSDQDVQEIAAKSAQLADKQHGVAPPDNQYAKRLNGLVSQQFQEGNLKFNYAVYISPEVNAFAMADGTIRVYSGLMDMLNDGELRFVIGHEMGHVVKNHIRKQIQLAYAASAVRKVVSSQNSAAGEVARSLVGSYAESLMNAQFSQLEEKEADDYGLLFLKREKYSTPDAVSALRKIAKLSKGLSFLSSHPDPAKRADRLQAQLEGRALSIEETQQSLIDKIKALLERNFPFVHRLLSLSEFFKSVSVRSIPLTWFTNMLTWQT